MAKVQRFAFMTSPTAPPSLRSKVAEDGTTSAIQKYQGQEVLGIVEASDGLSLITQEE
jgi:hypothetical protein